jgi:hypothetical protein
MHIATRESPDGNGESRDRSAFGNAVTWADLNDSPPRVEMPPPYGSPPTDEPTAASLPSAWRRRAAQLRRLTADERSAHVLEHVAAELDAALQRHEDSVLTLTAASRECGYTAGHLRRLIREGRLENAGRRNAPRVRRGDLPAKRLPALAVNAPIVHVSRERIARLVVNSSKENRDE